MADNEPTGLDDAAQPEPHAAQNPKNASRVKKRSKKKRKKARSKKATAGKSDTARRRGRKPYPVMTFEEALKIGEGIQKHAAGHPMKRTTLLAKLNLSDNQSTRNLITASSKYGITQGSHAAEEVRLTTPSGAAAVAQESSAKRDKARFDLGINSIDHFRDLYEQYNGGRMPAAEVMRDSLTDLDQGDRAQCVDIFISNARTVGILQLRDGANRLFSMEEFVREGRGDGGSSAPAFGSDAEIPADVSGVQPDFAKVCFFIAPIGEDGTEHRQHSDAILSSFVEPALQEHDLELVRADKISKPGMISAQILQYILESKLVVADLSFHNPNVFYELSLRHATGKPTVHVIRESETIPFDVANFRTVAIKMDSVYSVLAQLETHRAEIAQQIRQVLADGISTNNPILTYCPKGRFVLDAG